MLREIHQLLQREIVSEGAGVRLRRVFGFGRTELYDPFLKTLNPFNP